MPADPTPVLVVGHRRVATAVQELTLAGLLLRTPSDRDLVHVAVPHEPTVAFSARDLRAPMIAAAVDAALAAGFSPVVRSPGGRMVAYDQGAVVVDHVLRTDGLGAGTGSFADNATAHAAVLTALGVPDVRVGEVPGEYCPGEYSVNVGGRVKVVGSAQRVTGAGVLFSTVLQVAMSDRVRAVIADVSAALGYELRTSSVGGAADVAPGLTPDAVVRALAEDYAARLGAVPGELPADVEDRALAATGPVPFHVDDWVRAQVRPA